MGRLLGIALGLMFILASGSECFGQGPKTRYYPSRSTISPYLNYFMGDDPRVLDRYNAYVRPAQQLQTAFRTQANRNQQLQSDINQLRASGLSPTGIGGSFGNYSHYYSMGRR